MIVVDEQSLDLAWVEAMNELLGLDRASNGKTHHVVVRFPAGSAQPEVIQVIDCFLIEAAKRKPKAKILNIDTVANTIFPKDLYHPTKTENPRDHLYAMYDRAMKCHRRGSRQKETYFSRLTGSDGTSKSNCNQLEKLVVKMKRQRELSNPKSSMYELDIVEISDSLRVYSPDKDRYIMGFPCLSHISITLKNNFIHLTAFYRNQHFIRKAIGNYMGLSGLCSFIAQEVDAKAGDICCIAAHADAEIDLGIGGISRYRELLEDCRNVSSLSDDI